MHNNIMAAGSRDHPPMLAPGRYSQWRSRFLRYVDTRPNAIPEHTTLETPSNMSLENKAHFLAEKEAIHLILTGIGDDIYSTVDACQTAQEIWEAIESLQQVEYFGNSKNSPRMMEINKLCAEKLARNANPLALVATAQASQDPFYQSSMSHRSQAPSSKPSIPSRSHTSTRHKRKEIAKLITPPSETASEEDSDPEQAQRDKDMQKNLALIAKYFKKIYKHTNNNLRTSSNSKNKNVDTTSRYKNDDHSGKVWDSEDSERCWHKGKESQKGLRTPRTTRRRCCCASKLSKIEFEKYKAFNDRTIDYDKLERKLNEALGQLAHKDTVIRE
nr:hypothetical protein [Tanacetum cinerariifolium]